RVSKSDTETTDSSWENHYDGQADGSAAHSQPPNLFLYCLDNPLVFGDPDGCNPVHVGLEILHRGYTLYEMAEAREDENPVPEMLYAVSLPLELGPGLAVSCLGSITHTLIEERAARKREEAFKATRRTEALDYYVRSAIGQLARDSGAPVITYS